MLRNQLGDSVGLLPLGLCLLPIFGLSNMTFPPAHKPMKRRVHMYTFVHFNKKNLGGLPLVFSLLASTTLAAEPVADTNQDMEEIVVTANRISGTLDEIGSSIEVITAEDIARTQEMSVADVLRQVSGVSMSRTGGLGAVSNIRIRGAETGQAIVILNGVKLNDLSAPGGGYNFANLFTGDVSQIEVLKGPQSTLYGSDAMGGVVSINTKSMLAENGIAINAYGEIGSYVTKRGGVSTSLKADNLSGYFTVSYVTSAGFSAADENDGNTEADPYDNLSLSGSLDYSLIDNEQTQAAVEVFARLSNADNSFDQYDWVKGYVDGDEVGEVDDQQIGFKGTLNVLDGKFNNTFSANWSDIDRHDKSKGEKSFDAFSKRENFEYLAQVKATEYLDVLLGGEVENNSIITESFGAWGSKVEGKTGTNSLFSELKLQSDPSLTMTAGVRYDDHDSFGTHTSFRTTIVYNNEPTGTLFRANWGEGFRAPSLFQLYSAYGNVNLQPETSTGWELGIEQRLGDADRLVMTATYFQTRTQNQINFDNNSFAYANLDKTKVNGVEVKANYAATEKLSFGANYTHTNAVNVASDTALLRRPKNSFNFISHYAWSELLSNTVTVTYVGEQQDVGVVLPSYTVVDLTGAWQFHESAEIYARVENLFNTEYQEVRYFGTPDRSVYLGLRIKM